MPHSLAKKQKKQLLRTMPVSTGGRVELGLWRASWIQRITLWALPPQAPVHAPSLFYFTVRALATL